MTSTTARPAELTGRVVRPGDADYPTASAGYNLLFTHDPAAIVFAQDTQDVVNALAWARQNDVPLRVRSGRHSLEGWSNVDHGIVIDVSEMKSATIDKGSSTATVGVGLLTRNFGMASDNLIAAEVVVASDVNGAKAIVADENNNSDLLWALRGAGNGNFGIVTSLTYAIHPLAQTIYVTASWPGLSHLAEIFEAWQRCAPHTDNRLTSQLEIRRDEVQLIGVLASGSEAEATQMLAPILSVGDPDVSTVNASWADTYAGFQIPPLEEAANWKFFSQFVSDPFPVEAISLIGSFMSKAPTPDCNYFTNAFGGAVKASEPSGGSAFAHRDALFYAEPGAGWGTRGGIPAPADPLTAKCQAWIAEFNQALGPYVDGAYVNVPNAGTAQWETAYWGPNVDRLRRVKAKYDPENVFCFEQSVPVG
jgi:FAD/FMN-containing dehydrogenase